MRTLRENVHAVPGANALVGGQTAPSLMWTRPPRHDRNLIIPVVLVVIFLILLVLLRSLVAPIVLIATVVLSYLATLGICAVMFNDVFDFAGADVSFPLFAFVFLVALGVDYNIFLMTRVREESTTYGTRPGILRGLTATGGVITSAGIVLAATFLVLGVLPLVVLRQIGFAVALGVLIDTFIVRSTLVPALSYDIGRRIWWPSALSRQDPPPVAGTRSQWIRGSRHRREIRGSVTCVSRMPLAAAISDGDEMAAGFAAIRAELDVPGAFAPAVLAAAQRRPPRDELPHRDATDLALVTLDPPGAKDLDQALCLERRGAGYRVWYAIADVPAFAVPGVRWTPSPTGVASRTTARTEGSAAPDRAERGSRQPAGGPGATGLPVAHRP